MLVPAWFETVQGFVNKGIADGVRRVDADMPRASLPMNEQLRITQVDFSDSTRPDLGQNSY